MCVLELIGDKGGSPDDDDDDDEGDGDSDGYIA